MQITFDRVYQLKQEDPSLLLKDYLIPGGRLKFGRQQGNWFWHLIFPGIKNAVLPSVISALSVNQTDPGPYFLFHNKSYWTLFNRPFKKGSEPFSRTLGSLRDLPLESLFGIIETDFEVHLELSLQNNDFQPGQKDSAQAVVIITDHKVAAARLARWFDAEATTLDPRRPSGEFIHVGSTELTLLFRVPVYHDTTMPHLLAVPTDIISHLVHNSDLLCRGTLIAGLSGSGKTTTVKNIIANLLNGNKLSSLLIADTKGEYAAFASQHHIQYLQPGKDMACLRTLNINPFIPLQDVRLASHLDCLALILGIGGAGGGGALLPSFLKLLLEEFYFFILSPNLDQSSLPPTPFEQKLVILNMTGQDLQKKLRGGYSCLDRAIYQLLNFWKIYGNQVIRQLFKQGGESNGSREIFDVLASRLSFLETSVMAFFSYEQASSFDLLKSKKVCISLQGLSKNSLQQLMSVFSLLSVESILSGDESGKLKHLLLIEEAHHLAGLPSGHSDMLSTEKMLADHIERGLVEGRSKGFGLMLTDQQPGTRLISSVIANTTIKVCHNMLGRDGEIMAKAMGLPETTDFSTLAVGEAYIKPEDYFPAVRSRIRLRENCLF